MYLYIGCTGYICILIVLYLGLKRLAIAENRLEIGIDWPVEPEPVELELEEDLELELELKLEDSVDSLDSSDSSESKLPKVRENENGLFGLTSLSFFFTVADESELELVEEIEKDEGSFGLTLLCPAVEDELAGEEGKMTLVLSPTTTFSSSSAEAAIVRRRRRRVGKSSICKSILALSVIF